MVLFRMFVLGVLASMASAATAAPCQDAGTCLEACDQGDPAACIVGTDSDVRPLAADQLTAEQRRETTCSTNGGPGAAGIACERFAAHLWWGVGIKAQRKAATAAWERHCASNGGADWASCLAWAKAIERSKRSVAAQLYATLCQNRSIELACKAGGRLWTRVRAQTQGKKFSVELPAVMRHVEPWSQGTWHVAWSGSWTRPDVSITLENGKLTCAAAQQSLGDPNGKQADLVARHAAKYDWLPPKWSERICKSLRAE